MEISRRAHARIPCDRPVEIFRAAVMDKLFAQGHALNISPTGALLACEEDLKARAAYRLKINAPSGPLEIPFEVVRVVPRGRKYTRLRHYGVIFELTAQQTTAVNTLIHEIRTQPAPKEDALLDRLVRRYWSP